MEYKNLFKKYSKKSDTICYFNTLDTPVGKVIAVSSDEYLLMVSFEDSKNIEKYIKTIAEELSCTFKEEKNTILKNFDHEITEYFTGSLKKFTVPFRTTGSDFQKEVWQKLTEIPFGTTQTYSDLAKSLGRTTSHSRAVGAACGANAHILVIPCHRVVATNSKGGFSCGVDRKDHFIQHESKYA